MKASVKFMFIAVALFAMLGFGASVLADDAPPMPPTCDATIADLEELYRDFMDKGYWPDSEIAKLKADLERCLDDIFHLGAPSSQDPAVRLASCESNCTKVCDAVNVPSCVAGCIVTGKAECFSAWPDAPLSCTGECAHHCPPWKDPVKYSNCLVSCANTGDWACYDCDAPK